MRVIQIRFNVHYIAGKEGLAFPLSAGCSIARSFDLLRNKTQPNDPYDTKTSSCPFLSPLHQASVETESEELLSLAQFPHGT